MPPPAKSRDPLIEWSGDDMTSEKRYISTFTRPVATKPDREVATDEKMLFTKSYNSLIRGTYQVTWQMKNVISSFPRDLRPLIETGWGLIIKSHKLKSQVFFCSRDLPTKLEVVVAYEKGSPPTVVTLHKSRVKKSHIHGSWLPKSTRWWLMVLGHHAQSYIMFRSRHYM